MRWYNFAVSAVLWVLMVLGASSLRAEESASQIQVSGTKAEWQFIQQMCEAAKWASRIQFGDACEPLKARIVAAEAEAAKTADKPAPKSSSVDPGFGTPSPGLDEGSSAGGTK